MNKDISLKGILAWLIIALGIAVLIGMAMAPLSSWH